MNKVVSLWCSSIQGFLIIIPSPSFFTLSFMCVCVLGVVGQWFSTWFCFRTQIKSILKVCCFLRLLWFVAAFSIILSDRNPSLGVMWKSLFGWECITACFLFSFVGLVAKWVCVCVCVCVWVCVCVRERERERERDYSREITGTSLRNRVLEQTAHLCSKTLSLFLFSVSYPHFLSVCISLSLSLSLCLSFSLSLSR